MNENENLVTEEVVTENAEQTAEETPVKMFTQEEVNDIVGKRIARREAKIRKEYDRQYDDLMDVLRSATGKEDVGEITDQYRKFYEGKGIKINKKQDYSERDLETLAKADADEIIRSGYEEVVDEVDRLAKIGVANMSARDKALFKVLAEHRQNAEEITALTKIGVTEDVYNSQEFKDFKNMCKADTPITKIYETFAKTQPKKQIQPMGSMKNPTPADNGVKDYYSPEEARKFTRKELDENPAIMAAIEKSMPRWKR